MINWHALRHAIAAVHPYDRDLAVLLAVAPTDSTRMRTGTPGPSHTHQNTTSASSKSERARALVDLARNGDAEAFGQLYDHYVTIVFKFVYYRVGSPQTAEDLTSETFVRALRSIHQFTWQGRDFGAWLTTIARNLVADHHKSGKSRLEWTTDDLPETAGSSTTEAAVMRQISDEMLFNAVNALPPQQRDCVLMRFIQELSVAQTAAALGRSDGAIKQLQFRAVRNLANIVNEDAQ